MARRVLTGMSLSEEAIKSAEVILKAFENDLKIAAKFMENDPQWSKLPRTWKANSVRAAQAAKLWRAEGRQTLAIHPEIVGACRVASSTKIPTDVLRAIPYLNPMVVYAEPPVLPTWRNTAVKDSYIDYGDKEVSMRLLGFICYGQRSTIEWEEEVNDADIPRFQGLTGEKMLSIVVRQATTTHDPDADRFSLTAICEVLDRSGQRLDLESASFSIPFGEEATLDDLVKYQLTRFAFVSQQEEDGGTEFIENVYRYILSSLMYLASTTLDAEKVPAKATAGLAKRTIARKPLSLYRVGWTVGAALSKLRRERRDIGKPSIIGDIRHQQDPQHRRAHFKVAWCGPGRSIPKTVFIAPYWTHRERLGLTGVNTVRPVKKTG